MRGAWLPRARLATVALASSALALAGCGWQTGLVVPEEFGTVGLEFFDNVTFEPGLETDLASELSRSLVELVDVSLTTPDTADLVVRGVVVGFRRRSGIRNNQNQLLESGVRIDVEASLVRRLDGEVLREAKSSIWSGFAVDDRSNEFNARRRALEFIADELVLDLFTPRS